MAWNRASLRQYASRLPRWIRPGTLFALLILTACHCFGAELRSIQRGTATMAASGGKVYVGLGNIIRDTTKAFLVFSSTNNSNTSSQVNVAGRILGDDSLVFTRSDGGGSNPNSISWEVAMTPSTSHVTDDNFGHGWFTQQLTTATNLAIDRANGTGTTADMPWQLIAFSKNEYGERTYGTTINFNTTSTVANISSDQTNFPVLVRLDANNFLFSQANPNGADVRFSDPDGSPLKYQIERWDAANKLAELWVLVPLVSGNSTQDFIRMHWGNPSAGSASSPTSVFDVANSFSSVWHLNEDGNTNSGGYADATGNGYTGTGTSMTNATDVTGIVGLGQQLDGTSQYISMSGSYPANTAARTLCGWGRLTSVPSTHAVMANYGNYGPGNQVFGLLDWNTHKWGAWTDGGGNIVSAVNDDQAWHHHCASFDGSSVRYYLDGAASGTAASSLSTNSGPFVVGARMTGKTLKWPGIVDEIRMSTVQRSADWIRLEYENQRAGSRFLAMPNTALSTWSFQTKVYLNTTAAGANITANQSNYCRQAGQALDFSYGMSINPGQITPSAITE